MYTDDLYEEVIGKYCTQASQLNIISGYGSGQFLERVSNDYPKLKICLFIGMTHQGVPKNDHEKYIQLMTIRNNIEVYYQIDGSPTHMKVYHFINSADEIKLIGSANFSEYGFFHHREILTVTEDELSGLFEAQKLLSARCDSEIVKEKIKFIENQDELVELNYEDIYRQIPLKSNLKEDSEGYLHDHKINLLHKLRNKHFIDTSVIREVDLMLGEEADPNWQTSRLNAAFDNLEAYITTHKRPYLNDFFPKDTVFHIQMEDGRRYKAELFGPFKRNMRLLNGDWYLLVKERLDLDGFEPISRKMLEEKGIQTVIFERIDETLFNMYFSYHE